MENIRVKRLRKLITESFKGSQSALSALTGVSLSQLGQYLGGYRNMGEKTARKIERGSNKPDGWLDRDEENETKAQHKEQLKHDLKNLGFTPIQLYTIGVVHWGDIEKFLKGDVSVIYKTIHSTLNEEGAFAITLEDSDDSMTPEFSAGSTLILNPNRTAKSGSYVLARATKDGALTLKQLFVDAGQNYLKPINPRYPIIAALDLTVVAVVQQLVLIKEYQD
jgi:SOS-response transcriptional repressor LexA